MALLGEITYDPTAAATKSTASLLGMTALDTTNARITFTAPASGTVLVRIRTTQKGAITNPQLLLGVLESATVVGRQAPIAGRQGGSANLYTLESSFIVTGLSVASHTWDAAYGVEFAAASTTIGWGGPNDTTASNAYGALSFEVWEATNLLGAKCYDPGVAATKSTSTASVMAALDTTNLRLTFTAPASRKVLVRLRCMESGATAESSILLGALEASTVVGRQAPITAVTNAGTRAATDHVVREALFVVSGISAGSHTYDAAWGVETIATATTIKYGGPNNTVQDDAYGGFCFEIWSA
jgi:hypothetical protein